MRPVGRLRIVFDGQNPPTLKPKNDTVFVIHILIDNVKEMIMHYVYMDNCVTKV